MAVMTKPAVRGADVLNPAWEVWCRLHGPSPNSFNWRMRKVARLSEWELRQTIIDHMSFAIPTPEALDLIADHSPIVEIGAGTGYWAWCLQQMGVDILAYDIRPPQGTLENLWFQCWWTDVRRGGAIKARRHPDRALLMVWPYMDTMATQALKAYRGDTMVYVGEGSGGCTADDSFFDLLDDWSEIACLQLPQWDGINDHLTVWRR